MKTIKIIIISLLVGLNLTSCDFLEKDPTYTTPENFFKNEADATSWLTGTYAILGQSSFYGNEFLYLVGGDDLGHYGGANRGPNKSGLICNNANTSDPAVAALWYTLYSGINRANIFLENIDAVPDMNEEQIREVCQKLNMEIDDTMGKGKLIDEIFGEFCEGTYIQPTFITDYPKEMSPLTKIHRSNPDLTERFELMVNGKELCNAYSELNDPIDQLERFEEQMRLSEKGDDEAMIIDKDFVRALEYGMPPTSGMGIGMDRLTMLMTGQSTIQEVLFFPQMRPEKITPKDTPAKFMELGISEDWVPVIQKAGYNLVSDMKEVNPQKLHMDICGINKKYKLELTNPTVDEVAGWIAKIEN